MENLTYDELAARRTDLRQQLAMIEVQLAKKSEAADAIRDHVARNLCRELDGLLEAVDLDDVRINFDLKSRPGQFDLETERGNFRLKITVEES